MFATLTSSPLARPSAYDRSAVPLFVARQVCQEVFGDGADAIRLLKSRREGPLVPKRESLCIVARSRLARSFGSNVRRERERRGLSVRALGEMCGMDGAGISRLENAERDARLSTVERLAEALGVSPLDLLRDSK